MAWIDEIKNKYVSGKKRKEQEEKIKFKKEKEKNAEMARQREKRIRAARKKFHELIYRRAKRVFLMVKKTIEKEAANGDWVITFKPAEYPFSEEESRELFDTDGKILSCFSDFLHVDRFDIEESFIDVLCEMLKKEKLQVQKEKHWERSILMLIIRWN